MKPDLEPDKAASKIPLLTFSRRLPTASFSPRPWLTIHHWMADPVQQLEKTSRVTLALGDVRAVRGLVLRSSQVHQLPLDGGKHGDPGAVEERRAPPCLPKSRQMGKGTGFGVSALGPAPPAEPPSSCGRRFSLQSLSLQVHADHSPGCRDRGRWNGAALSWDLRAGGPGTRYVLRSSKVFRPTERGAWPSRPELLGT